MWLSWQNRQKEQKNTQSVYKIAVSHLRNINFWFWPTVISNLISTWTKNTAQPRTALRPAILPFRLLGNLTCFGFILQIVHNDLLEEKVLAFFPDISDGYVITKRNVKKIIFWKAKHWKAITNAKQLQSETVISSMQQMLIWFGFETAKCKICIGYNTTSGDDQVISGANQMWHDIFLCVG